MTCEIGNRSVVTNMGRILSNLESLKNKLKFGLSSEDTQSSDLQCQLFLYLIK